MSKFLSTFQPQILCSSPYNINLTKLSFSRSLFSFNKDLRICLNGTDTCVHNDPLSAKIQKTFAYLSKQNVCVSTQNNIVPLCLCPKNPMKGERHNSFAWRLTWMSWKCIIEIVQNTYTPLTCCISKLPFQLGILQKKTIQMEEDTKTTILKCKNYMLNVTTSINVISMWQNCHIVLIFSIYNNSRSN